MAGKATLPREVAWQIRQMSKEINPATGKVWTQMDLAAKFMVGETTVYRAIHNRGAYAAKPLPEAKGADALQKDAEASLQRFLKLQEEPVSASEKMAAAATEAARKAKAGDTMLSELKGEANDGQGK